MKRIMNILGTVFFVVMAAGTGVLLIWGDDMQASVIADGDGHAVIQTAAIDDTDDGERLNIRVLFKETPPAGSASTVELTIESSALAARSWTWAELAEADDDPTTTASSIPPLGQPLTFSLPVHLLGTVLVEEGQAPGAIVRLQWAGATQHGYQFSLANIYE